MYLKIGRPTALTTALAALVAVAGIDGLKASEDRRFFTIGTAATSGTYFPVGALIANVISSPPGSRPCDRGGSCGVPGMIAVAQSTQGSVENVRLIGEGQIDSAFVQADVATWAYTGTGTFANKAPVTALRAIASLYPEDVHIVVRKSSGIGSVAGLKGKKVSLGERESGTLVEALIMLEYSGLSVGDIVPSYDKPGRAADRLEAGEIDAFFSVAGAPVPVIADLADRIPIDLLPIGDEMARMIVAAHPYFTESVTPAGAYNGVGPRSTLSVGAVWLISAEIDPDVVHAITRALWHERNRALLDNGHPKGAYIQQSSALRGLGVPLHPGAERYYRESGLIN